MDQEVVTSFPAGQPSPQALDSGSMPHQEPQDSHQGRLLWAGHPLAPPIGSCSLQTPLHPPNLTIHPSRHCPYQLEEEMGRCCCKNAFNNLKNNVAPSEPSGSPTARPEYPKVEEAE